MTVIYELSQYVDIARVVNDSEYASEKHLTVKEQNAVENSTSDKLYLLQYIKNKLNYLQMLCQEIS